MPKWIPFNINEDVKVKLTDKGRAIHKQRHDEFVYNCGANLDDETKVYSPKKEDEEGWSKWQLWVLIELFGPHIHLGIDSPFEMEIEFGIREIEIGFGIMEEE